METDFPLSCRLLNVLFTVAPVLITTLGLALVVVIRRYFCRPGALAPRGNLNFIVNATPRALLKNKALVTGGAWVIILWVSADIAAGLLPLATVLGVIFLAVLSLAFPLAVGSAQAWREKARARKQCRCRSSFPLQASNRRPSP